MVRSGLIRKLWPAELRNPVNRPGGRKWSEAVQRQCRTSLVNYPHLDVVIVVVVVRDRQLKLVPKGPVAGGMYVDPGGGNSLGGNNMGKPPVPTGTT